MPDSFAIYEDTTPRDQAASNGGRQWDGQHPFFGNPPERQSNDAAIRALPAVDIYGNDTSSGQNPNNTTRNRGDGSRTGGDTPHRGNDSTNGDGKDTKHFVDGGHFTTDSQGRITETVSADGGKTRKFSYEDASNPNEITKIEIDGNRVYTKGEGDAWNYYEDGQFRGQWHGSVNMENKDGLYSYHQSDEDNSHYFGSAREEMDDAALKKRNGGGGTNPDTGNGGSDDDAGGIAPDGGRKPEPNPNRPDGGGNKPDGGGNKPDGGNDRPDQPDKPKPKKELDENYHADTARKAIDDALKAGVPVIVHVGSRGCGPCRAMESSVWPDVQKQHKGQAAFVHINYEDLQKSDDMARKLAENVTSWPTIMVIKPTTNAQGQLDYQTVRTHVGGMNRAQTEAFIGL